MGNCVFRSGGFGGFKIDEDIKTTTTTTMTTMIKVVTSNGGMMELYAPITAECITNEFPGHALFRSRDVNLLISKPLLPNEDLCPGELYYLRDTTTTTSTSTSSSSSSNSSTIKFNVNGKFSTSISSSTSSKSSMITTTSTPYRMSLDNQGGTVGKKRWSSEAEVFPRYNSTGVWKVKLVISPEQLSEILSQEARTEALIESVRTVAKCGNGLSSSSPPNSDQYWSTTSH